MTQKLTLSIDQERVRKIKVISRKRKRSVSKLVEDYIDELSKRDDPEKISVADQLKGAFGKAPKNFNWKKEREKYLLKKYGH